MRKSNSIFLCEKLMELEVGSLLAKEHTLVPEILLRNAVVRTFAVPLSSGVGEALYFEPSARPAKETTAAASLLDGAKVDDLRQANLNSGAHKHAPLVVLLHGLGDSPGYPLWHWIDWLLAKGNTVLSLSWDGHGISRRAGSEESFLDFQLATRTLPLLFQKLFGKAGETFLPKDHSGPSVFLMGHSVGAALALICASRSEMRRHIRGVVAVSPSVCVSKFSDYRKSERSQCFSPGFLAADFVKRLPYYGISPILPAFGVWRTKVTRAPILRCAIPLEDQLAAFVYETFERRRVLENVEVPVLWLHGAKDKFVPMDRARKIFSSLQCAFFAHADPQRGHMRMAFSSAVPEYAGEFISRLA